MTLFSYLTSQAIVNLLLFAFGFKFGFVFGAIFSSDFRNYWLTLYKNKTASSKKLLIKQFNKQIEKKDNSFVKLKRYIPLIYLFIISTILLCIIYNNYLNLNLFSYVFVALWCLYILIFPPAGYKNKSESKTYKNFKDLIVKNKQFCILLLLQVPYLILTLIYIVIKYYKLDKHTNSFPFSFSFSKLLLDLVSYNVDLSFVLVGIKNTLGLTVKVKHDTDFLNKFTFGYLNETPEINFQLKLSLILVMGILLIVLPALHFYLSVNVIKLNRLSTKIYNFLSLPWANTYNYSRLDWVNINITSVCIFLCLYPYSIIFLISIFYSIFLGLKLIRYELITNLWIFIKKVLYTIIEWYRENTLLYIIFILLVGMWVFFTYYWAASASFTCVIFNAIFYGTLTSSSLYIFMLILFNFSITFLCILGNNNLHLKITFFLFRLLFIGLGILIDNTGEFFLYLDKSATMSGPLSDNKKLNFFQMDPFGLEYRLLILLFFYAGRNRFYFFSFNLTSCKWEKY